MGHELTTRERLVQGNCTAEEADNFLATLESTNATLREENEGLRAYLPRVDDPQDIRPFVIDRGMTPDPAWVVRVQYAGKETLVGRHRSKEECVIAIAPLFLPERKLRAENARLEGEVERLRGPEPKRIQPCGCQCCVCDNEERCLGCGAHRCANVDGNCVFRPENRENIVYETGETMASLRAENAELREKAERLEAELLSLNALGCNCNKIICQRCYSLGASDVVAALEARCGED